jgi:hypothetical protein
VQILAKVKPEDAVPGIAGKQVPLPDEVVRYFYQGVYGTQVYP